MVAEDQLESVLGWGIKIDAVLCIQPNHVAKNDQLNDQWPLQFISYRKSASKLKVAVEYLVEKKHTALNVLAQSTEVFLEVENSEGIAMEVFLNNQKWTCIANHLFEKWLSEGTTLSVFPVTTEVLTKGLSKSMTTYQDGMVMIRSTEIFWVGEPVE